MYAGTATHTTLLARLGDNADPGAWSEFVARYGDLIQGFCLKRGLQAADIDDVRQDVLLSLTKAMPGFTYDPAKGLFRSYLKTVVMNAITRRMCQNSGAAALSQVSEPGVPGDATDEQWEDEWRRYHLRLAMKQIETEFGAGDRTAFTMYALEGRDAKETAAALGMSVDAVYQAKSRIVRRLGEVIERQVAEEG